MKIGRAHIGGGDAVFGEIDGGAFHVLDGDPFSERRRTGRSVDLGDAVLQSPTQPRTVLLILGGFLPKDGTPLPPGTEPRLVPKVAPYVTGPGAEIVVPSLMTTNPYIEVELAVVIGREVRGASVEEARAAILGYTCFNDVSAPEFMLDMAARTLLPDPDYFRTKSLDTFASMGPWVETGLTEQDIADGLRLTARVNGEVRGEGTTRTAKFPPSQVVSYVSQGLTLHPGDVIALGTPQPCEAGPGDVVTLEVEGIGSFTNTIVAGE